MVHDEKEINEIQQHRIYPWAMQRFEFLAQSPHVDEGYWPVDSRIYACACRNLIGHAKFGFVLGVLDWRTQRTNESVYLGNAP